MSDYYQLGPCEPAPTQNVQQSINAPQMIAQFQDLITAQREAMQNVMVAIITPLVERIQNQDRQLVSVMQPIINLINQRVSQQSYDLGQFINDFRSIMTSEISEQKVLINLLTDLLQTDTNILQALTGPGPSMIPPLAPVLPGPPAVIPPVPAPAPQPAPVTPPAPAAPPGTTPAPPAPIIIKVPVYMPCPTVPPPDISVRVSDVVDPIFNSQNTVSISNAFSGGGGLGGGGGEVIPPEQPPGGESTAGGGGGEAIPYPVDLDQPLAFMFSPDDSEWKRKAVAFYGDGLPQMTSDSTLQGIQADLGAINKQLFPNNFLPENANG